MYEEELVALKTAHSNLTIEAKLKLNGILSNYKFDNNDVNKDVDKDNKKDEKECDSAEKFLREKMKKYLDALMHIVHEMTADYNQLPGTADGFHLSEMERDLNLLLPYTDPCCDLHDILKKCKMILENREKYDQDWTSRLSETLGEFSSEFLKIQDLVWKNW